LVSLYNPDQSETFFTTFWGPSWRNQHIAFMRNPLLLFFTALLFSFSCTPAPDPEPPQKGFLHAEGTRIVDAEGNEVLFRGWGLGGWYLQEGYMLGTSGPQHSLEARFEDLVGKEKKEEFYEAWLANYMRKIDVDSLASFGFNLIRLPMHYQLFTLPIEEEPVPGEISWIDKGFEMTDQLLEWCKANDVYLILDLHAAPGGQGKNADISDYDPTKPSLWESEAIQEKTIALWRKLAERYAEEPMIAGYDIINEPNWGFQDLEADPNGCSEEMNAPLWDLSQKITRAIREVDTNHIVIIEGNCWGNNYRNLPELWDDNLVISFHKYWNPNSQESIQHMLDMREERNVPIWLGETGENSNTWFTNAIKLFEENNMGWCWWPWKKQGFNNPYQVVRPVGYQRILDYWKEEGPKPSEEEAYAAMMQLAENMKLENNLYHPDVVDAMLRQPHSREAIPYKDHVIESEGTSYIFAVDFDMGREGVAYQDNESQNITTRPGGQAWNLGRMYRNDGVDIERCTDTRSTGYNVGWTEAGEWMQYTVRVEETGQYELKIRHAGANGEVQISANGLAITGVNRLPDTGGEQQWQTTTLGGVDLEAGENVLRLDIRQGGMNLNYLAFDGEGS